MYNRRIKIFLIGVGLIFLILIGRLFHLQILRGEEYRRQISRSLESIEFLPASRGRILDRNARILAMDEPGFDFCADYRFLVSRFGQVDGKPGEAFLRQVRQWRRNRLKRIVEESGEGLPPAQAEEIFERRATDTWAIAERLAAEAQIDLAQRVRDIIRRVEALRHAIGGPPREQYQYHPLIEGLDDSAAVSLKLQLDEMVGVSIRPSRKRSHPYGSLACHVVGVIGQVNQEELDSFNLQPGQANWLKRARTNYWSEDIIGKSGLEKMCESVLRGRRGYRRFQITSPLPLDQQPAEAGNDIHTTLDAALQRELAAIFPAGKTGCIVILSVPRGEVLALVSVPTFDLNRYRQDYARLASDEVYSPLYHRAVAGLYAPGSTAKPLAALAGLQAGVVNLSEEIFCRGYLHSPQTFRCWIYERYGYGHSALNVVAAIKNSCNVFFYTVGERLYNRSPDRLKDFYALFGLLNAPGTGLPEEKAGRINTPKTPGVGRMLAIGQGPIAMTPLHVANAMAAIARGGELRSPVLVLEGGPPQTRRDLGLAGMHIQAVQEGMYQVVNSPGGTAYRVFHEQEGPPLNVQVCGKTGTAESPPLVVNGQVVRSGDMAWFAGFAPYRDPQIALAVVVEYAQEGGAREAGPIAREAVRLCKEMGYIH